MPLVSDKSNKQRFAFFHIQILLLELVFWQLRTLLHTNKETFEQNGYEGSFALLHNRQFPVTLKHRLDYLT